MADDRRRDRPRTDADSGAVVSRLERAFADDQAVTLGGPEVADEEVGEIIGQDIARAELIAFPILFLVSLWVFRGFVAALMPPMVGMGAVTSVVSDPTPVAASVDEMSLYLSSAMNPITARSIATKSHS